MDRALATHPWGGACSASTQALWWVLIADETAASSAPAAAP